MPPYLSAPNSRATTLRRRISSTWRACVTQRVLPSPPALVNYNVRLLFNQAFKSVYAMVPADIMLLLILIPCMLTALSVVREKELGSIANFYSAPATRVEFLIGKQLPYFARGLHPVRVARRRGPVCFSGPAEGQLGRTCYRRA